MELANLLLCGVVFLLQFHGVRSGSAETCQMIDFGGVTTNLIGIDTFTTPFTQDKSTLYSFLNSQAVAFIQHNTIEQKTYSGINFHLFADDPTQPQMGAMPYVYGWFTNITIGFNSWFTPLESGEYTFSIDTASDAAALYIYDNQDMLCCDDLDFLSWLPRAVEVINIPTDPEHTTGPKSITLEAGKNYLFSIVYVNFSGDAELSISITDPSGQPISDLGPYMSFPIAATCDFVRKTSMIYSLGTDSLTSTYSTSYRTTSYLNPGGELYITELETIYYILTPPASSSSEIIPSSSETPSSSSSELLTSYDSSVIESSSDIITSSSELVTSDDPSIIETSSDIISSSSEATTSNGVSSSSEVTLSTLAPVISTSISDISSSEFAISSTSDELPTSSVTSSSQIKEATTDPSITSAENSSVASEGVASSSSSKDVGTNGVLPTISSGILSEYSTDDTSDVLSATISDGAEEIETTAPEGSIYINSTLDNSGVMSGSSSGLVITSLSTKELDGNSVRPTHSTVGSAVYTVVRTVTNILGQTTTTVVTCTENTCQPTGASNEEQNESMSSSRGVNRVTLSPVGTIDVPVATSKELGIVTDVPRIELSTTGKYDGSGVVQAGSSSVFGVPTTTFSVVAAPNGSDRNQRCLIASVFSFFIMLLLL